MGNAQVPGAAFWYNVVVKSSIFFFCRTHISVKQEREGWIQYINCPPVGSTSIIEAKSDRRVRVTFHGLVGAHNSCLDGPSATVIEITTENYMFPLTSIRVQCVGEVIQYLSIPGQLTDVINVHNRIKHGVSPA
jgi:hypothetical protein